MGIKTANLTVRVDPVLKQLAKAAAESLGMSLGSVIETAFRSVIGKADRAHALERADGVILAANLARKREIAAYVRDSASIP